MLADIERLRDIIQEHCFRYGDFTLASGRKSSFYFDGRRATFRPAAAKLIGEALVDVVLASGATAVGGPALGAVPIAMAVGLASLTRSRELPVFVVRSEAKQHGAGGLVVQPYNDGGDVLSSGARVAIVEDTITTGGSVLKAIDAVEELGAGIALLAVLVERAEGGANALREKGYDVASVFLADEKGRLSIKESYVKRMKQARG
jgi:orotate phosphoribosyltransferase